LTKIDISLRSLCRQPRLFRKPNTILHMLRVGYMIPLKNVTGCPVASRLLPATLRMLPLEAPKFKNSHGKVPLHNYSVVTNFFFTKNGHKSHKKSQKVTRTCRSKSFFAQKSQRISTNFNKSQQRIRAAAQRHSIRWGERSSRHSRSKADAREPSSLPLVCIAFGSELVVHAADKS
jgi:hypothetical protein